jgi:D-alanine--poly(phosphoribitol) ligase subunit 2
MTIKERVLATLAKIAEIDELRTNPDILLYEMNVLDSMKTVELMVALSDQFGLEISPAEFDRDHWSTPDKIVQYIEARVS